VKRTKEMLIRVIREQDKDAEFLDTNVRGSYLPFMRNRIDGLVIIGSTSQP
jgi:hypothetical protein